MPTGYTSDLYDGKPVTPAEFIMRCARAFGALIEMRDESPDAKIPEAFEPHPYYAEQAEEAKKKFASLIGMSQEKRAELAKAQNKRDMDQWLKGEQTRKERRERYEAMFKEIEAWEPPTPDHFELRNFMLAQLSESIDFDCNYKVDPPKMLDPEEWWAQELTMAEHNVEYYKERWEEELDRVRGRNEWVRALRDSLPT